MILISNPYNISNYKYDGDSGTTITDMTNEDTDYDGLKDGEEDWSNHDDE